MATHSSILAWEISWTEELGGLQEPGVTESRTQLGDLVIMKYKVLWFFPDQPLVVAPFMAVLTQR